MLTPTDQTNEERGILQLSARKRATLRKEERAAIAERRKERARFEANKRKIFIAEAIGACLETVPWIGAFIRGGAFIRDKVRDGEANALQTEWLREHDEALSELARDLVQCRKLLALVLKANRRGGNTP